MKVATSNIVTSSPVKREAAQFEAKDLALRGSNTGAILEEITDKIQRHYFSLIMDIGTDIERHTLKGEITWSYLIDSMLQLGLWDTKDVQHRQMLEN